MVKATRILEKKKQVIGLIKIKIAFIFERISRCCALY
jgi:hypothetical protein